MRQALSIISVLGFILFLAGCQTTGTTKPCGVIQDSLKDVNATTRDGNRRLAGHYERGRGAGCW